MCMVYLAFELRIMADRTARRFSGCGAYGRYHQSSHGKDQPKEANCRVAEFDYGMLEQPHGRRHKAPPQPCALTTTESPLPR